jgi:hypothetical protein
MLRSDDLENPQGHTIASGKQTSCAVVSGHLRVWGMWGMAPYIHQNHTGERLASVVQQRRNLAITRTPAYFLDTAHDHFIMTTIIY